MMQCGNITGLLPLPVTKIKHKVKNNEDIKDEAGFTANDWPDAF
jgi:hypothetical protein